MRVKRQRMYTLLPKLRGEHHYAFQAIRLTGWYKSRTTPRSYSEVDKAYGSTPTKAKIALRKTRYRRPEKETISRQSLDYDRRWHDKVKASPKFSPPNARERARLREWLKCEHDWVDTHPRSTQFAIRCTKCNARKWPKPGGHADWNLK